MAPETGTAPRRTRLGVLGGTFDPIHRGHLAMAQAAREAHRLDRVVLVPAGSPPHKRRELTPFHHRLAMAEIAARCQPALSVSDLEGRRGGISFTVDSLSELSRREPDAELFFIIGEDSIPELPQWRELGRILSLARMVAVNRPGPRQSFNSLLFAELPPEALARAERDRVQMEPVDIASRQVRQAIASGRPIDHLLPPGVGDYIRLHGLYTKKEDQP
jgi:nicotinate-nucleotide adenylyltransferase